VLEDELRIRELRRKTIVHGLLVLDRDSDRISRILVPDEDLLVSSVVESRKDWSTKGDGISMRAGPLGEGTRSRRA